MPAIDHLIRDLHAELRALDLPGPTRLQYPSILHEIDAVLAPARLPIPVRRLWELIDPGLLQSAIGVYPQLSTPEFSLESWHQAAEIGYGATPRSLLPDLLLKP
jgi:hypothetical protein